jgi:hypothetical protein
LYEELYKGWIKREKEFYADGMLPRTEILWMKNIEIWACLMGGDLLGGNYQ